MTTVVLALGLAQARRLARHPLVLADAGMAGLMLQYGLRSPQGDSVATLTQAVPFYLGPAVFFAAHLGAAQDRRAGTTDLIIAGPTAGRIRAGAALLAVVEPVTVAVCVVGAAGLVHWTFDAGGPAMATLADIAIGPVVVGGAGVLGVATAYSVSWRAAPFLVMAGLVLWCLGGRMEGTGAALLGETPALPSRWQLLTPYVELPPPGIGARLPGSMAWHNAYVGCLGLLAAVGAAGHTWRQKRAAGHRRGPRERRGDRRMVAAVMSTPSRRSTVDALLRLMAAVASLLATPGSRRALFAAGVVVSAGAAFAGWWQLP